MNILLTAILCANVAILVIILLVCRKLLSIYSEFIGFVSPIDEKTPSPIAQLVSSMSDVLARSLIAQAKATFMGIQSGEVRADKAVSADIALEAASMANPAIGAILGSFPALKKTLRRNPQLLDLAMSKLMPKQNTTIPVVPPGSNGNSKVRFNF